jgi:hypothetical protein
MMDKVNHRLFAVSAQSLDYGADRCVDDPASSGGEKKLFLPPVSCVAAPPPRRRFLLDDVQRGVFR